MTTASSTKPGMRLRVVTWNIHGYVGLDRIRDVDRVARHVKAIAPDIAAFQEVDTFHENDDGEPQVDRRLREAVGGHGHPAWSIRSGPRHYGQVLMSRFPLGDAVVHDISFAAREPRRVIAAHAYTERGPVRIMATHLGLQRRERHYQLQRLSEIIMAAPHMPTILLGDLNEWARNSRFRHMQSRLFDETVAPASFPSRFPLLRLDRICCRGGLHVSSSRTAREASTASDHLPVVADISTAPGFRRGFRP